MAEKEAWLAEIYSRHNGPKSDSVCVSVCRRVRGHALMCLHDNDQQQFDMKQIRVGQDVN